MSITPKRALKIMEIVLGNLRLRKSLMPVFEIRGEAAPFITEQGVFAGYVVSRDTQLVFAPRALPIFGPFVTNAKLALMVEAQNMNDGEVSYGLSVSLIDKSDNPQELSAREPLIAGDEAEAKGLVIPSEMLRESIAPSVRISLMEPESEIIIRDVWIETKF